VTPALEGTTSWPLDSCDALLIADSAAGIVEDFNLGVSDIVLTTDLDGGFTPLGKVAGMSKLVAVHAHGDNPWLLSFIKNIPIERVIVTSQVPLPQGYPVLAPFGFTDADRAFLLGLVMGYEELVVPWSYTPSPKRWSIPSQKEAKIRVSLSLMRIYAETFGYRCSVKRAPDPYKCELKRESISTLDSLL